MNKLEVKGYDNLFECLEKNDYTLLIIYSPNCPHCQQLLKKLYDENLIEKIHTNYSDIQIAIASVLENEELINGFKIEAVPTFIGFHNKTPKCKYVGLPNISDDYYEKIDVILKNLLSKEE